MRPRLTFQIAPVELVQTLKRDAATFLGAEQRGDFLPRLALLALFADEIHERFETAVEWRARRRSVYVLPAGRR